MSMSLSSELSSDRLVSNFRVSRSTKSHFSQWTERLKKKTSMKIDVPQYQFPDLKSLSFNLFLDSRL